MTCCNNFRLFCCCPRPCECRRRHCCRRDCPHPEPEPEENFSIFVAAGTGEDPRAMERLDIPFGPTILNLGDAIEHSANSAFFETRRNGLYQINYQLAVHSPNEGPVHIALVTDNNVVLDSFDIEPSDTVTTRKVIAALNVGDTIHLIAITENGPFRINSQAITIKRTKNR